MELTKGEKLLIQDFLDHTTMYEVVKKVLFEAVQSSNKIDYNLNNEHIGSQLRARKEAQDLLKLGFSQLERYRKVEEPKKQVNSAR